MGPLELLDVLGGLALGEEPTKLGGETGGLLVFLAFWGYAALSSRNSLLAQHRYLQEVCLDRLLDLCGILSSPKGQWFAGYFRPSLTLCVSLFAGDG